MKVFKSYRIPVVLLAMLPAAAIAAAAAPVLRVAEGTLQGAVVAGTDHFLGVPFAAPPTGDLRWKAPAPPLKWDGIRDASKLRSKCPQNGWTSNDVKFRDESCLFLNIYRPLAGAKQKPVIVWLHGGAYVRGSSQDVDGSVLARKTDAIVVTVNYRLGVFGFLSLAELARESGGSSGNYGLMDQQAALRWVQANIAQFGGNPAAVTLMGQSAGAGSTWVQLVSPASHGLFSRAIMMSGAGNRDMKSAAQEQASGASSRLAAKLGCAESPNKLACMRGKTTDAVIEAGGLTPAAGWTPVIDGKVLAEPVENLVKAGKGAGIPILSGIVSQEAGFSVQRRRVGGTPPWSAEDYNAYVRSLPDGEAILKRYPASNYSSGDAAYIVMSSDISACNTLSINNIASKHAKVYGYEFDDRGAPSTIFHAPDLPRGAFHTLELPYFFQSGYPHDVDPALPALNGQQIALSDRIIADLRSFVWSGSPGPADRWSGNSVLRWQPKGDTAVPNARYAEEHECAFWQKTKGE